MGVSLKLTINGATPEEIVRGLNAAMNVFEKAGINPYDAAGGKFARDLWDDLGFPEDDEDFTDHDAHEAAIWDQAEEAAVNTCCASWPEDRPRTGDGLEVIIDDDTRKELFGTDDDDEGDDLEFTPEQQAEFEAWQEERRKTGKA